MHADFQELLSLRAGEPVRAEVAQHVARCPRCGLELGRLQRLAHDLNQLPQFEPPTEVWASVQQQLALSPARRARERRAYVAAACAALIAVAVGALWFATNDRDHALPGASNLSAAAGHGNDASSITALVRRSQDLEALLNSMPQRPAIERAATSVTIDEIQSSIQMLDLQLADGSRLDPKETERLWNTRVQLLDSLVYVRYAEVARDAHPMNLLDTGAI